MSYVLGSDFFKVILFCFNDINVYYVIWKILGLLDNFLLMQDYPFASQNI